MRRTTILVADDHPMICAALRKMLEPGHDLIGCVEDGWTLIKFAVDMKPDVVLVDLGLPGLNGLEAGRELKKLMPGLKLIFLTMNRDPDIVQEAFRIGASGYVLKDAMGEELVPAIHDAMRQPA
ncbi:MAG TPA: response regulator transcription factor [Terracidiphilus sp.]|nr:response regulator transcription factor [Terracidiphilus sp.]